MKAAERSAAFLYAEGDFAARACTVLERSTASQAGCSVTLPEKSAAFFVQRATLQPARVRCWNGQLHREPGAASRCLRDRRLFLCSGRLCCPRDERAEDQHQVQHQAARACTALERSTASRAGRSVTLPEKSAAFFYCGCIEIPPNLCYNTSKAQRFCRGKLCTCPKTF